jgi:hypothetical protein
MTKKIIKQNIQVLSVFIIILYSQVNGQDRWFLSPGFKIGYAFGENGGFINGIEVSIAHLPESSNSILGACLSVERLNSDIIIHFAFESAGLIGASIGPTLVISKQERSYGFTGTLFGGILLIPYCRYTYLPARANFFEAGTFVKFPFRISGPEFDFKQ